MDVRILREPTVYLVGRQSVDAAAVDRFLADHGVRWQTDTEVAGRVCYLSFARPRPGGNKAYLDNILEVGHGSVVEHAVWNFVFTGISRSCSHGRRRCRRYAAKRRSPGDRGATCGKGAVDTEPVWRSTRACARHFRSPHWRRRRHPEGAGRVVAR